MAHIVLVAVGSRGDVQPYVALGKGLQAAGHHVALATHLEFKAFVQAHDLEFRPIGGNPRKLLERSAVASIGSNPLRLKAWIKQGMDAVAAELLPALVEAGQGADLFIYSTLGFPAYHLAESMRVPAIAAYLQPITTTREFPSLDAPDLPDWMPFQGIYNRLSYRVSQLSMWMLFGATINRWRTETLGIAAIPWSGPFKRLEQERMPLLYGYSPLVIPRPADWPDYAHVTGYWFLDGDGWNPPADLMAFLEAGPPPVYVGFGSMTEHDPEQTTWIVVEALNQAGQRGIILSGWAGMGSIELPETIFRLDEAPHDWLFPRVAAVVHHGGAGTTAAGLRAGMPSISVPFFADQFSWAGRVFMLGAGVQPIPRKKLTAERLATAIRTATTDQKIRDCAAVIGQALRAEDGVGCAVKRIEAWLSGSGRANRDGGDPRPAQTGH